MCTCWLEASKAPRLTGCNVLISLAPSSMKLDIVDIGQLPFFNQDIEVDSLSAWTAFRRRVEAADAVLFVTPEY